METLIQIQNKGEYFLEATGELMLSFAGLLLPVELPAVRENRQRNVTVPGIFGGIGRHAGLNIR